MKFLLKRFFLASICCVLLTSGSLLYGVIISKQSLKDLVLSKVPDARKSKSYKNFIKTINCYTDDFNEVSSEDKIKQLLHCFLNKMCLFPKHTIIYKILKVVTEFICQKLDLECPICLEKVENQVMLSCCSKSVFCKNCLISWYCQSMKLGDAHSRCPLCRKQFELKLSRSLKQDDFYHQKRKFFLFENRVRQRRQEREDTFFAIQIHNRLNPHELIGSNQYVVIEREVEESNFNDPFFSDDSYGGGYDLDGGSSSSESEDDPFPRLHFLAQP